MLYHSRADESFAIVPSGKLTACDASLRLVEEDVEGIVTLNECGILEWLSVADTHLQSSLLAHLESLARLHPMHLIEVDA